MFNPAKAADVSVPTRTPDHTGSRFKVWFAERIVQHIRTRHAAKYCKGSLGNHAYVCGIPEHSGVTVAEYFESETLEDRLLDDETPKAETPAPIATPTPAVEATPTAATPDTVVVAIPLEKLRAILAGR